MITKIKKYLDCMPYRFLGLIALNMGPAAPNNNNGYQGIDLTIQGVFGIITGLACWFTRFALILMVVYIVFYGIKFMMAQGNEEKFGEAKKSFTWGLVGVLVILGTYTIIATIANGLGADYSLIIPLRCR